MHKTRSFTLILTSIILLFSTLTGQIKIKELPSNKITKIDSLFYDINSSRNVIPLNLNWRVYSPGAESNSVKVSVPSTFKGETRLVYEKDIFFSVDQIKYKHYRLEFLGVNYRADVLLNGMVIHKHPGGTNPFYVDLPSDLLRPNTENQITLNVYFELDDISTIPTLQRFLYPSQDGGIFRDVYLQETEKIFISNYELNYTFSEDFNSADVHISARIINNWGIDKTDSSNFNYQLKCVISNGTVRHETTKDLGEFRKQESAIEQLKIRIENPILRTPSTSRPYRIELSIILNETLVDQSSSSFSLFKTSVEDGKLLLNNSPFEMKAVTYIKSDTESGGLISKEELLVDLALIKESGFNTIRFSKGLPHPYALFAMEKLELFALVEIPLNSVPDQIAAQNEFVNRINSHFNLMLESYGHHTNILAFGLGGGYLGSSEEHISFLNNLSAKYKDRLGRPFYASFIELPEQKISTIDLYGIELFSSSDTDLETIATKLSGTNYSAFISEATYPSFAGNSNGYLNNNSYEAAAKYFSDIIDFSNNEKLNGFVINSFFDYSGDYKSFYAGYNNENIYSIGLLPDAQQIDRISYKVVKAKLTDANKITIPIGTAKDDSPILFVLIGLGLSILMALLINSKRKFREDAGRALIRPYNFFADIRDHRILSGFQTNFLMLILAGSSSLLLINLLYFLRSSIMLEKLLLAFGIPSLIDYVIFIAWHPLYGFGILFLVSIIFFFLLCIVFKIFSFFLKNKVFFSGIYYSVIWAFLPLALLLPIELVLYRVLIADVINLYLYIFIGLYLIWLFQRMIKGIYVIFDVRLFSVYLYGIIFIVLVFGGILFFFQLTNSTVYHIIHVFTEYKFL